MLNTAETIQALSLWAYEGPQVKTFDESEDVLDFLTRDAAEGGRYVEMRDLPETPAPGIGRDGFVRIYPDESVAAITPKGCRIIAARRIVNQVKSVAIDLDRDLRDLWASRRRPQTTPAA